MQPKDQCIEVWGELACFTRPELKVERFSYPVITPSAARGIYDAIFCKPQQFRWQITAIEILPWPPAELADLYEREERWPPGYIALRRNEVKEKISVKLVSQWMKGKGRVEPIYADAAEDGGGTKGRTQRQTMALKHVHYRLHAEIRPWPGYEDKLQAFEMQFRRRAGRGQCYFQPYLGCREFPAYFRLVEPGEQLTPPMDVNTDLGLMLYDVFDLSRPGSPDAPAFISFFRARVEGGVIRVPPFESDEVIKPRVS